MPGPGRFPELDAARGIAIIMMVFFHIVFDLSFFSLIPAETVQSGFFLYLGRSTAFLFIVIAGISGTISISRAEKQKNRHEIVLKFLKRGLFLLSLGMGITVCTFIFLQGSGYVVFGILHLIGVCVMLIPVFAGFKVYNALIGGGIILLTPLITGLSGPFWLIPTGIHPSTFFSVDYVPLFPWLGVFLLGIAVGSILYPGGDRRWKERIDIFYRTGVPPFLASLGKHSLLIYLVHQPVIVAVFFLLYPGILLP
ncbi:MAG: DUF1624 domain-containing protein [Methanospirillaceae archaeon]|nr:DUF1624 domain-containing protein [Methanospirillaceae archaeon]